MTVPEIDCCWIAGCWSECRRWTGSLSQWPPCIKYIGQDIFHQNQFSRTGIRTFNHRRTQKIQPPALDKAGEQTNSYSSTIHPQYVIRTQSMKSRWPWQAAAEGSLKLHPWGRLRSVSVKRTNFECWMWKCVVFSRMFCNIHNFAVHWRAHQVKFKCKFNCILRDSERLFESEDVIIWILCFLF